MNHIKWTNKELNAHVEACSSVKKIIKHRHGVTYVYKHSAILNENGNLVSLEEFMKRTGQRVMVTPKDFSKTEAEKRLLKAAKADYKQSMYEMLGPKWREISRIFKIHNVPENRESYHEIKELAKNYYP